MQRRQCQGVTAVLHRTEWGSNSVCWNSKSQHVSNNHTHTVIRGVSRSICCTLRSKSTKLSNYFWSLKWRCSYNQGCNFYTVHLDLHSLKLKLKICTFELIHYLSPVYIGKHINDLLYIYTYTHTLLWKNVRPLLMENTILHFSVAVCIV